MKRGIFKELFIFSSIFVPLFTTISPKWLTLQGVGPCWSVLWLLPWSLQNGPNSGWFAGLCLGLFLDGISLGGASYIPALMLLGFWWGRLGNKEKLIDLNISLGLFAWIGSIVVGLSIWLQKSFLNINISSDWFNSWAIHTLFAQAILTGILAPMVCSWILSLKRPKKEQF